jgi:hypothetical protein
MKIRPLQIGAGEIGAGEIVALEIGVREVAAVTAAGEAAEKIRALVGPCGRQRQRQQRRE